MGAIAAVRLVTSGQGTEVWVADRITGKTVIRELVASTEADVRPDDVALGAIELLRASLMELHSPSSPRGEADITSEVRALSYPTAERPRPRTETPALPAFSLSGGPSLDLGLDGVGPSLHSQWAAWLGLGQRFGARAFASLSLLPGHHEVPEGSVEVASNVLGLGATFDFTRQDAPLVPTLGVGAAAARVETVGRARAPFMSTSESSWFAGGYGQLGIGWRVAPASASAPRRGRPRARDSTDHRGEPPRARQVGRSRRPPGVRHRSLAREVDGQTPKAESVEREQIGNALDSDVGCGVLGDRDRVVRVVPLPRKDRRHPGSPDLFHGGEDAQLVVDEHEPIGRVATRDVVELLLLVDVDEHVAPRPRRRDPSDRTCAAGRRRRRPTR